MGYNHSPEVRKYFRHAEGLAGRKIIYLSDFHFCRWSRQAMREIVQKVCTIRPDTILLGGDYADSGKGLVYFREMMSAIAGASHILAIPGNHDWWCKHNVRQIVEDAGGIWIEKTAAYCQMGNAFVRVDSRSSMPPVNNDDKSDLSILCLHQPIDVRRITPGYDLIFAGHLHGGQMVLWENVRGLYPGRLLYRWNRTEISYGNCQYLISKGLGDTLPLRYNCKKDLLLVEIINPFR